VYTLREGAGDPMNDYLAAVRGCVRFMLTAWFLALLGGVLDKLGIDEKVEHG
jgi:hypothetical protein